MSGSARSAASTSALCSSTRTTHDSRNAFYAGNSLNDDGTSTANAFGYLGPANHTAYGCCQRTR